MEPHGRRDVQEHVRVVDADYEEIGSQLGVTRNHVAILIFRGKQALRRLLADLDERA